MVTESKVRLKSAGYGANNKIATQTCLAVYTQIQIRVHLQNLSYFRRVRAFSVFSHRPAAVLFIDIVFAAMSY